MIAEIRRLLEARPFEPFLVRTSDGREYAVPTTDHASVHPRGFRMIIWLDDGTHVTISSLHVAAVIESAKS